MLGYATHFTLGNWMSSRTVSTEDYAFFLDLHQISFIEEGLYYRIGDIATTEWELFISVMVSELPALLRVLLPVLFNDKISFRLIRKRSLHFSLNDGDFGLEMVGKVIILYPEIKVIAARLTNVLISKTSTFHGPNLSLHIRLGKTLFATYQHPLKKKNWILRFFSAKTTGVDAYCFSSKRCVGKYYRPRILLQFSPKGEIHKGIDMQTLSWCLIKRGRCCAFEDEYGRTIRDRLQWQAYISLYLGERAPVPKVLDYIEEVEDTYLVLEYLEGMPMGDSIAQINSEKLTWKDLDMSRRQQLLQLFLNVLESVNRLHAAGIVHRDLTESNLIDVPGKGIFIIDLELSYDLNRHLPLPPFFPGAPEFRAPEQNDQPMQGFGEDIYSLGCLLSFLCSYWKPPNYNQENRDALTQKLMDITASSELTRLILNCTDPDPQERPSLTILYRNIQDLLSTQTINKCAYEK